VRRRAFMAGLGAAVAWPVVAGAQQSGVPVVGFLASASEAAYAPTTAAVRSGLNEAGYVEKRNLLIEYRWAKTCRCRHQRSQGRTATNRPISRLP
jgi:putative tryptophan/tyrosine transport system substrate-binding protein